MTYYVNNTILKLGKILGSGGEGTVYEIPSNGHVAKILTTPNPTQESKINALRKINKIKYVSLPEEVILDASGRFAGFTMEKVDGSYSWHQFNVEMSRKKFHQNHPDWRLDAGFIFNMLRSFAEIVTEVHRQGLIIGDVNESNILIDKTGQTHLIDSDSFQLKPFYCTVARPEYLSPKLQNKNLSATFRTQDDDCFGFAVLTFSLICNGIHPFMGRGGSSDIRERIMSGLCLGHSRYAPPKFIPDLKKLPNELREWFVSAFTMRGATIQRFAEIIDNNRGQVESCLTDFLHLGPSRAKPSGIFTNQKVNNPTSAASKVASGNTAKQSTPTKACNQPNFSRAIRLLKFTSGSFLRYAFVALLMAGVSSVFYMYNQDVGDEIATSINDRKPPAQLKTENVRAMHSEVFKGVEHEELADEISLRAKHDQIFSEIRKDY